MCQLNGSKWLHKHIVSDFEVRRSSPRVSHHFDVKKKCNKKTSEHSSEQQPRIKDREA